MNECLRGIRSINWIQRNVIHYCLHASRCSGFCKLNSFIMVIPLFCQMHHFHLSGLETSSEWLRLRQWGHGWHSMRWERENRLEWRVACDNHNWGLWVERRAQCSVAPCWTPTPPCISCGYCGDLKRVHHKQWRHFILIIVSRTKAVASRKSISLLVILSIDKLNHTYKKNTYWSLLQYNLCKKG